MDNYIGYTFAFLGVLSLVGIRFLDNKCVGCSNNDSMTRVIGSFIVITALGPKNSKLIAEKIAEKISSFTITTNKKNEK